MPGIGDAIFVLQKLVNQPERFHFELTDKQPQRGKQLFDLLPQITESARYVAGVKSYKDIEHIPVPESWDSITDQRFYLQCNGHLEAGKRIETFLPDLAASYVLPYVTGVEVDLPKDKPLIGIYTSAYSNARHWGGWRMAEWFKLIGLLGYGYRYVIIGAAWDIGIPEQLCKQLPEGSYINTVGEPLPVVLEILKQCEAFIGFPSGLSILNETAGCKRTLMFYPKHLRKMMNAWADPKRIESGEYKGCQFGDPTKIYYWIKENWSL